MLVTGFFTYRQLNPQVIRPDADYSIYSLDELEGLATAIVEVEYERETSSVVQWDKKDKFPLEAKTFSEVKVTKIYKGNDTIKVDDTLSIVEYYAKWKDLYGSYQEMPNKIYMPLIKGKKYLLFLYQGPTQPPNTYEIIGNHQGKFVIPEPGIKAKDMTAKLMDIYEEDQEYSQLYDKVAEKYAFDKQAAVK
ncbi:hypothetical protein [Gorillibacterium sp. sgz500922]|uniref:hypothetical protein n=1 Tax=Gorillibacterium sp. sgz500922 TaxID=3446694 RepID=UPI003F66FEDF